jgi:hypothetical protein
MYRHSLSQPLSLFDVIDSSDLTMTTWQRHVTSSSTQVVSNVYIEHELADMPRHPDGDDTRRHCPHQLPVSDSPLPYPFFHTRGRRCTTNNNRTAKTRDDDGGQTTTGWVPSPCFSHVRGRNCVTLSDVGK